MQLTTHERIMHIFRNEEIDRPALKLWGAGFPEDPQLHPAYQPVSDLAAEVSDLFIGCGFNFNMYAGMHWKELTEVYREDTKDPTWKNEHIILHTPKGDLHMVDHVSTVGKPTYTTEFMVKEPEDLEKLLSLPYMPFPVDSARYEMLVRKLGDRGVVMPSIDHASYALQRMVGSENLAYFSVDCRNELREVIDVYSKRVLDHTKAILDTGIQAPFSWVGPELYLPPLMRPDDFREFVTEYDKPVCDLIHNAGGYVWVHSHGKVAKFVDQFIEMGVDVLNPLEPPKNGDIDMQDIISRYGRTIGWEGNIEIQELLLSSKERIRMLIDECVAAGQASGRFILCPSAGYMEYPFPTAEYIDNLLFYLQYGLEAVERYRK